MKELVILIGVLMALPSHALALVCEVSGSSEKLKIREDVPGAGLATLTSRGKSTIVRFQQIETTKGCFRWTQKNYQSANYKIELHQESGLAYTRCARGNGFQFDGFIRFEDQAPRGISCKLAGL